ncbi:aldehyde dehydrogenase family protein [Pontiella sulfatireligans]|uniref:NAD/NADP-dependent betaine aldehyde dehydrogenase n=1 Tax=Pontiella sulfatireligans TaxID=2750658 RepID=A0A6C2UFK5_9BACT|nr:aldehyde dehydrogenase family protein [Pontiella sulfatireligans]VGO18950.1 NAD/NADP-dependent betaine aldehyde dehydrogenase [Pontiella sulfatireligans]
MKIPEQPRSFELWINGEWTPSEGGATIPRMSPAHDCEVTRVPAGTAADVDKAVAAAKASFESGTWAQISGAERSAVLYAVADRLIERKEELALLETLESGKPLTQAGFEVEWAAGLWKHAAALCRHLYGESCNTLGAGTISMTLREPIGVVGLITPWNFPLLIASQKAPYALAAGCSAVIKPSELTSATTLLLAEILKECGVPDGVFNVVTGYGNPVGQTLCEHKDVEMISFTGSIVVGKAIAATAACNLKKVCLELGGKNPMIVMDDADLDSVVDAARLGAFFNMGECCNASSRILVQEGIADEFVKRLTDFANEMKVCDPLEDDSKIGAIINETQEAKILGYVQTGREAGATVCMGGGKVESKKGRYLEVTILDHVPADSPVATEEVFGPVLSIVRFQTLEEAIAIANGTDFGLSAGIFTNDYNQAMTASRQLRAGTVWVNTWLEGHAELSFGGYKQSGLGRELGSRAVEEYTEEKSILFSLGKRQPWW